MSVDIAMPIYHVEIIEDMVPYTDEENVRGAP